MTVSILKFILQFKAAESFLSLIILSAEVKEKAQLPLSLCLLLFERFRRNLYFIVSVESAFVENFFSAEMARAGVMYLRYQVFFI